MALRCEVSRGATRADRSVISHHPSKAFVRSLCHRSACVPECLLLTSRGLGWSACGGDRNSSTHRAHDTMDAGVDKSVALKAILVRVVAATSLAASTADAFCLVHVGDREGVKVGFPHVIVPHTVLTRAADENQVEGERSRVERMLHAARRSRRSRTA